MNHMIGGLSEYATVMLLKKDVYLRAVADPPLGGDLVLVLLVVLLLLGAPLLLVGVVGLDALLAGHLLPALVHRRLD